MDPNPRTLTGLARLTAIAILATACGTGSPVGATAKDAVGQAPESGDASPPPPMKQSATAPVFDPAPTLAPASSDAWLVVGRKGEPGLQVVLASTQEVLFDLPTGTPDGQWGRLVVTEAAAPGATIVRDLVVQPGFGGPTTRIDGAWHLPTIGLDPVPVGVSGDGATIVLAQGVAPGTDRRTRFAVLRRGFAAPARIIDVPGRFDYDALSPDGAVLYVVEHLDADGGGPYQVRAIDLATGRLRDGAIADKTRSDESMAGDPLGQVRRSDGGVLTLYRGFVHALNSAEGWAVCIDLPGAGSADPAGAPDWGLAQSPDGRTIYAANASLGLVVEIDPLTFELRRSATVEPLATGRFVLAKFGHQAGGPAGRRVVVGPDGRTIYAAAAGGILAIDANHLKVERRWIPGRSVDALAATPDGGSVYALLRDEGRIVELDATTGDVLATVPGRDYDRLLAVVPW